ncbi:MAG: PilZ domain-containing protein [Phycisphaerae bacterium]|jgi:c-di-GMP-binding flagellar brake protein YcgR
MNPRRSLTRNDAASLFDEAVHERALAVLTYQQGDDWRSFKSRFLERDPAQRFFVLDHQPFKTDTMPNLLPGQCVGVSFRNRSRKILFATVVEARGHFLFDDRTSIPALRFRWPDSITELQRRSYYRTPIPDGMTILATLWPGGPAARTSAQGRSLQTITGALADISCGGALVRLNQVSPPTWTEETTLGVELQLPDGQAPLVASACFRGVRHDEVGQMGVAFQFIGLELSVDGRLVLQRLASCVQHLHRHGFNSRHRQSDPPRGLP